MDYLPLFHDLKGQRCLVVGGGEVGTRKAAMLLRAGAHIRVVAISISDSM
ncbi:MAG: NAD(P)-dependent oxidoreductase, partial [Pseudomonadales bacterium]|nr:NAD(P)-dependent oxidoreductase [Pseudomonadales bacterium]